MKNYVLGTLPVSFPQFLVGTFLHGAPYSVLWTVLGSQMSDVTAPVAITGVLKGAVMMGMGWGVVGAPIVIARELRATGEK